MIRRARPFIDAVSSKIIRERRVGGEEVVFGIGVGVGGRDFPVVLLCADGEFEVFAGYGIPIL
jgi:hypothetical protein